MFVIHPAASEEGRVPASEGLAPPEIQLCAPWRKCKGRNLDNFGNQDRNLLNTKELL